METEEEKKKRQREQAERMKQNWQQNAGSFQKGFNSKPETWGKLKKLFTK